MPEAEISPQGSGTFTMGNTAKKTKENSVENEKSNLTVKKHEAEKAKVSPIDVEKRIKKVENLNIVIGKWRKLHDAKNNLDQFRLSNDGLGATLLLKDASGREFKTSHNVVVEAVLEEVKSVLDTKIVETESQIDFE